MELNYEELFTKALSGLIDRCGGSMEEALDESRIFDEEIREQIKQDFGWKDE